MLIRKDNGEGTGKIGYAADIAVSREQADQIGPQSVTPVVYTVHEAV